MLDGAEQVYVSVPSQTLRENLAAIRELVPARRAGRQPDEGRREGHRTADERGHRCRSLGIDPDLIAVASGPNLALEIARRQPTAAVVSSRSLETATVVAAAATNPYFRSFVNTDVIGTEFGGVLKNLIAVAIGIVDGVGYGENTKASIITRGLAEMTEFAVSFGAKPRRWPGSPGSATSSRRASRRCRATTRPGGCSARATASTTSCGR